LTRRLPIAALVVPALVVVAFAARSYQPFGGEPGDERAASTIFVDSLFTIVLALAVLLALILIYVRLRLIPQLGRRDSSVYSSLLVFLLFMGLVVFVGYRGLLKLDRPRGNTPAGEVPFAGGQPVQPGQPVSEGELARPHVVWPLAIGIGGIIVAAIVIAVLAERRRDRRDARTPEELRELWAALDDAIEDLRRDPDPRRAVVAAYARMEQALTVYGLPRRPAEAPYEYLRRIGRELEAEEPVAALTELFEVAKFSEHSVDETMRGRAIDALTDVRREVRAAT
jgi:Domain of unknown function (DUF4129)